MREGKLIFGICLGAGFYLLGVALKTQAEILPIHSGTRLLKCGDLVVEIDDPAASTHNRYNRTARRFSPMAMVLRAQFKGREFLYSPVDGGAYGYVGGAPMEFDLGEKGMNQPPGFAEAVENAPSGEGDFLKVGVGILRKATPIYSWGFDYPVVELAEMITNWDARGDRAGFRQTLKGTANGYAYALEETVLVSNNQMIMQYRLRNTGQKRFVTEQYIHNFLVFSGQPVGPHYQVRLPYDFQLRGDPGPAIRRIPGRNVMEFWKVLPADVKFRLSPPLGFQGANTLTVEQSEVKQALIIDASLPSNGVDLWCTDRQLSPEMLVLLELDPGQEKQWSRTYTFSI